MNCKCNLTRLLICSIWALGRMWWIPSYCGFWCFALEIVGHLRDAISSLAKILRQRRKWMVFHSQQKWPYFPTWLTLSSLAPLWALWREEEKARGGRCGREEEGLRSLCKEMALHTHSCPGPGRLRYIQVPRWATALIFLVPSSCHTHVTPSWDLHSAHSTQTLAQINATRSWWHLMAG